MHTYLTSFISKPINKFTPLFLAATSIKNIQHSFNVIIYLTNTDENASHGDQLMVIKLDNFLPYTPKLEVVSQYNV